MRWCIVVLFISLIAFSCKKDDNTATKPEVDFVKGDVIVGIGSAVSLDQLFSYVNALNLAIDEISGYHYTTTIPKDSIPYIKGVLDSKPYINTRGFSGSVWPHYLTQIVYNTSSIWNMTLPNQQDYIQTLTSLRMTDILSPTKYMLLKVPIGDEVFWKDKFITFPWVRWTELNQMGGFVPL